MQFNTFNDLNQFLSKQSTMQKGKEFEKLFVLLGKTFLELKQNSTTEWIKLWGDLTWQDKGKDLGIDLVAKQATGEYFAIQCKYRADDSSLSYGDVTHLLSELSNTIYKDEANNPIKFSKAFFVTNLSEKNLSDEILKHASLEVIAKEEIEKLDIEWTLGDNLTDIKAKHKTKNLRAYQEEAVNSVYQAFYPEDEEEKPQDKGKLVMACGTGKTFTALKIIEKLNAHTTLFLVPNLALLTQSMDQFNSASSVKQRHLLVCGEDDIVEKSKLNKTDSDENESFYASVSEIPTASTNDVAKITNFLKESQENLVANASVKPYVIFSTYQSLHKVQLATKNISAFTFDLVLCDEAHRTTGLHTEESNWQKATDTKWLKRHKSLYMTATPRYYSGKVKKEAKADNLAINSMDDADGLKNYGSTIYSYNFQQAIKENHLSDYKVVILTINATDDMEPAKDNSGNFKFMDNTDNATVQETLFKFFKSTTIINTERKILIINQDEIDNYSKAEVSYDKDGNLFKEENEEVVSPKEVIDRVICFTNTVRNSELLRDSFSKQSTHNDIKTSVISGAMGANRKKALLNWLKESNDEIRILSNARCLTEGVDVPKVNAILFAEPKRSKIDIVQAVGRAIRKSENKKYSYIILPIIVPQDLTEDNMVERLANSDYDKIWDVLKALRNHDKAIGYEIDALYQGDQTRETTDEKPEAVRQRNLNLNDSLNAKVLEKCGDRRYLEQWTSDLEALANRTRKLIKEEYKTNTQFEEAFDSFWDYFKKNINRSLKKNELRDLLANQYMTEPIFKALFPDTWLLESNPIYKHFNELFSKMSFDKSYLWQALGGFYEDIAMMAKGTTTFEGKQELLFRLYEDFLRKIDKDSAIDYGLVYTPIEAVKFIVRAISDVLKEDFGKSLLDDDVMVLDPFSGTGSFGVEMIRYFYEELCGGMDSQKAKDSLIKFYTNRLFSNEIMLLPYYITCINIEYYFNSKTNLAQPFEGITLVDTFLTYDEYKQGVLSKDENLRRIEKLRKSQFTVIMGNPPYNDSKGQSYDELDDKINNTYVKNSNNKGLKSSLYNSYIKAIRYASDKLKDKGLVAMITGNSFINSTSFDGFRASLLNEFATVYHLDLKGDATGVLGKEETSKQGEKFFGQESRSRIGITLLVKDDARLASQGGQGKLMLHQVGNYLKSSHKKAILTATTNSTKGMFSLNWQEIVPVKNNWINFGNAIYDGADYVALGHEEVRSLALKNKPIDESLALTYFNAYTLGAVSSRDNWCTDYDRAVLSQKMTTFINTYNNDVDRGVQTENEDLIKYTVDLLKLFAKGSSIEFSEARLRQVYYRPFTTMWYYFDKDVNERHYQLEQFYPFSLEQNWAGDDPFNLSIITTGNGAGDFSVLMINKIMDLNLLQGSGQNFSLYRYVAINAPNQLLDHSEYTNLYTARNGKQYARLSNINQGMLDKASTLYGKSITDKQLFYYVYALLHHASYRSTFKNDLFRGIAKLPLVDNYTDFSSLVAYGESLAKLHLNYDKQERPANIVVDVANISNLNDKELYKLRQIKLVWANQEKTKLNYIKYNEHIKITGLDYTTISSYKIGGNCVIKCFENGYKFYDKGIKKAAASDPYPLACDPNGLYPNDPKALLNLLLSLISMAQKSVVLIDKIGKIDFLKVDKDDRSLF